VKKRKSRKQESEKAMTQTQKLEEQTTIEATEEYRIEQVQRTAEDALDALAEASPETCAICGHPLHSDSWICGFCIGY
jgi:hypothetical protein